MSCSKNGLQTQIDLERQRCRSVDTDAQCKRALKVGEKFLQYGNYFS